MSANAKPRTAAGEPRAIPAPRAMWIARGIVALGAIAVFGRSVTFPLIRSWDDGRFLIDSDETTEISWRSLVSIFSHVHFEAYHPIHLLSYWIDVPWSGGDGAIIHATNVVLWCAALIAVLQLMRELGLSIGAATIATLLFGLHTVQVEAVVWATGRKEILAIGLASASWLLHLRSQRWDDRASWGSRALFVLAALAKTTVLPLPLVMMGSDVLLRRRELRDALRAQIPSLALALAIGGVVVRIWSDAQMIRSGEADRAASTLLVPATIAHHVATAFWPSRTSPLYPLARDQALDLASTLVLCGMLGIALAIAWRERKTELGARVLLGLGAFFVLLAPVSNVVPLYFQWHDRYLSLPLLGLAFAAGALLDAARGARWAYGVAALALVALGARTLQYATTWRSGDALFENAVGAQPHAFYAWLKLGEVRRDDGRYDQALRAYAEAIDVAPQLALGHAAFFTTLMMRDERRHGLDAQGLVYTSRFVGSVDDAMMMRGLAGELADLGYRDAVTYALGRALDIEPIDDERLERAATVQIEQGNLWLAQFYVGRLTREPVVPAVRAYVDAERRRRAEGDAAPPAARRATRP